MLWCQDRDSSEWVENQQVSVTTHYAGGITTYCQFEKLVVFEITAFCQPFCYLRHPCVTDESRQEQQTLIFMEI